MSTPYTWSDKVTTEELGYWMRMLRSRERPSGVTSRLLALDPGNTTGWALLVHGLPDMCGQIPGTIDAFDRLFLDVLPTMVVCEDYKIYPSKLEMHTLSPVLVSRKIGWIEYIAHHRQNPLYLEMAVDAKGYVTDNKLKKWGLYLPGKPHALDALRHGLWFTLFGKVR